VQGLPTKKVYAEEGDGALPFVGANSQRLRDITSRYYSSMNRLDESIGMLFDSLRHSGTSENTLLIYMSDHGAQFDRGKSSNYEGGLKVSLIASWKGKIQSGQVNEDLISSIDILPTILDVAGIHISDELPGKTFLSLHNGKIQPNNREFVFADGEGSAPFFYFPRRSIRGKKYKLIHNLLYDRENPKYKFYLSLEGHFGGGPSEEELNNLKSELWKEAYERWHHPPKYEL